MGGGDSEHGVVAIVQGLRDAGLAVTLMSRAHLLNSLRNRQQVPATSSSVETSTECDKQNTSTQMCQGRYISTYQLAHCNFIPKLPSQRLPEFPLQRVEPTQFIGNFQVEEHGNSRRKCSTTPTSTLRGATLRYSRGSFICVRSSYLSRTDAFMRSLRRYPLSAEQSVSSELVQRLLNYTQAKHLAKNGFRSLRSLQVKSTRKSSDKNPPQLKDKNPIQSQDNSPHQSREDSPLQSRDKRPLQFRGKSCVQSKDKTPRPSRNNNHPYLSNKNSIQTKTKGCNQCRDKNYFEFRDKSPLETRDTSPQQSLEKSSYQIRNKTPFQSRHNSPLQVKDNSPNQSRHKSPFQRTDASPYQSRDKSPLQSRDNRVKKSHNMANKNIQTYTRTINAAPTKYYVPRRRKKGFRKTSYEDARYKLDRLSETYNYLKATYSKRRSYNSSISEIRYINDVKRRMKDTIKQMVDDTPCVCPKFVDRKSHHKKSCHSRRADDTGPRKQSIEVQAEMPSTSGRESGPMYQYCPFRPACPSEVKMRKDVESQAGLISAGCSPYRNLTPLSFENICLFKRPPCTPQPPCIPCPCPKNKTKAFDKKIEEITREWLKEVPVYANDTPKNKAQREEMVKNLAGKLKSFKDQEDYIENAKIEIKQCIDNIPMWYPGAKRDQEKFKKQIADSLIEKLKSVDDDANIDNLNYIVSKWLDAYHIVDYYGSTINQNEIAENVVNRLKPKMNRRSNVLRDEIIGILKELQVINYSNEIANDLINEIEKLKSTKTKSATKLFDDNELKENIYDWLETVTDMAEQLKMNNQDLIQNLAFKLKKLKSDNANNDLQEQEIKNFLHLLNENGIPMNHENETLLVKNLLNKTKPKQRKRWNQEDNLHKLIVDELSELTDVMPFDISSSNRKLVEEKLADVLAQHVKNQIGNEEVNRQIKVILYNETKLPDAAISDITSALINKVKNIPNLVPDTFRQSTITADEMKDIVKEEVDHILEYFDMPYNDKDSVEQSMAEVLADQLVKGTDDSKTQQKITDILRDANVANDAIRDICDKLIERHRKMFSKYRSLDSTLNLLKSAQQKHYAYLNSLDKRTFEKNAVKEILDFIENVTGDDSSVSKYEIKEATVELAEKLATIMSDSKETNKDDSIMLEVSKYLQKSSIRSEGPREELAKKLKIRLQNIDFETSTPHKKGIFFFPKNLSAIKFNDTVTKSDSQIFHDKGQIYKNAIIHSVNSWINNIGLNLDRPGEKTFQRNIIKKLARDIEDRQKYLQRNPDIKTSDNDELEHMKYQIFRRFPDTQDISSMMSNAEALMDKIKRVPVPQQLESEKSENTLDTQYELPISKEMDTAISKHLPRARLNSSEKSDYEYVIHGLMSKINRIRKTDPTNITKLRKEIQFFLNMLPIENFSFIDFENQFIKNISTVSIESKQSESDSYIKEAVIEWINTLVLIKPNTIKDLPDEVIDQLTSTLTYLLVYRSKVPINIINDIEKAVSDFVDNAPVDTYKTPTNKVLAKSLFQMIKEYAKKGYISPTKPVQKKATDTLLDNIAEWSNNLPIKTDTLEEIENAKKLKQDIAIKVNKIVGKLNINPEIYNDDLRYEELLQEEIINIITNISKEDSNIRMQLPGITKDLVDKVKKAKQKASTGSPGQQFHIIRDFKSTSTLVPSPKLSVDNQALFELNNATQDAISKHARMDSSEKVELENLKQGLTSRINKIKQTDATNELKLKNTLKWDDFENQFMKNASTVPVESYETKSDDYIKCAVCEWIPTLFLYKPNTVKDIPNEAIHELISTLKYLLIYTSKVPMNIINEIEFLVLEFIEKVPVDTHRTPDYKILAKSLFQMLKKCAKKGYFATSKNVEKSGTNTLLSDITDWGDNLPIKQDTPERIVNARKIRHYIASNVNKIVRELNENPEIFNDDFQYEQVLEHEIDNFITNVSKNDSNIRIQFPTIKDDLIDKIRKLRHKSRAITPEQELKQNILDDVSKSLPSPKLSANKQTSFQLLKNNLAEVFTNLNYTGSDEIQKNISRKTIGDEIDKLCHDYSKKHSESPIDPKQIHRDLSNILNNMSANSKDDTFGKDSNLVELKNRLIDWVKEQPLKKQTSTEQLQTNKLVADIAKKLLEIEKEEELFHDRKYNDHRLKREVSKLLTELPMATNKNSNIEKNTQNLLSSLKRSSRVTLPSFKETEHARRLSTSTQFSMNLMERKPSDALLDNIIEWSDNLPIKANTPELMKKATEVKQDIAHKINKKLAEVNMNPEVADDDVVFENMFKEQIDDILLNLLNEDSNIRFKLPTIKKDLLEKVKNARQKNRDENLKDVLQKKLADAISDKLQSQNLFSGELESFVMLKDSLAEAFTNLNYADNDKKQIKIIRQKIETDINKFCDNYSKKHPESPIDPNQLIRDVFNAFNNISAEPKDKLLRKEEDLAEIKTKVNDWIKDLPLKGQTSAEQLETNKIIAGFVKKVRDIDKEKELSPNREDCDDKLKNEIVKLMQNLLLTMTKNVNMNKLEDKLLKNLKNTGQFQSINTLNINDPKISRRPSGTSRYSMNSMKEIAVSVPLDDITDWSDNLPIKGNTPEIMKKATELKQDIASKVNKKLTELNINPKVLNDDVLFEQLLEDKIDDILSNLAYEDSNIRFELPANKRGLLEKVKNSRQETRNENVREVLKQKLTCAFSDTLPSQNLSYGELESFVVLKDSLAEAFTNLNYADEEQKKIIGKKIEADINKFCDNFSKKHPESPIDSNQLRRDVFNAFNNISADTKDKVLRKEGDLANIKDTVNDWIKDLPLKEQTSTELLETNKIIVGFVKKLHDIEKEQKLFPDREDYGDKLKNEVTKLIQNLPWTMTANENVNKFKDKLLNNLKNTEQFQSVNTLDLNDPKISHRLSSTSPHYMNSVKEIAVNVPLDDITDWSGNLPIKADVPESTKIVTKVKRDIASKVNEKLTELNMNPEVLNNDILFEQLLENEIDDILSNLSYKESNIRFELPAIKKAFLEKVKSTRQKDRDENLNALFKKKLSDVVSNTLQSHNLSSRKLESFDVLKNNEAEDFPNFKYAGNNEKQKKNIQKKYDAEVIKFNNEFSIKHPESSIDTNQLNRNSFNAFNNILTEPKDKFLKKGDLAEIKDKINDWIIYLPLKEQNSKEQLQTNKLVAGFTKNLCNIEKEKKLSPNSEDYDNRVIIEVSNLLRNLPLKITEDENLNKLKDILINNLKHMDPSQRVHSPDLEDPKLSRRLSASSRYSKNSVNVKAVTVSMDDIADWSDSLPIKADTPERKKKALELKRDIVRKVNKKLAELNMNLEVFYDDVLYGHMLENEIDKILCNLANEDSNIKIQLPTIKENLIKKIHDARLKTQGDNSIQVYQQNIRDAISKALPSFNVSTHESASFELLKDNVAEAFTNLNSAGNDENQNSELRKKIEADVKTLCDGYSKKHPESAIDPKNLRREFLDTINDIPNPRKESFRKDAEMKAKINKWIKDLPLKEQTSTEQLQTNKNTSLFAKTIHDIENAKELFPDRKDYKVKVQNAVAKLMRNVPLTKNVDINKFSQKLIEDLENTEHLRKVNQLGFKHAEHLRKFNPSTKHSVEPVEKKATDILLEDIANWSDKLPIKADTLEEKKNAQKIKHDIAGKIIQILSELNMDPEAFNDDFLYEHMLDDKIDNILSNLLNEDISFKSQLSAIKNDLINKAKAARLKAQDQYSGKVYKQNLREAISNTLPFQDLSEHEEASFKVLKENLADAFINLHYVGNDEIMKNKLGNKIKDEINKFCNNYLKKHPKTPIDTKQLNLNLYKALKKVSEPKQESLRNEVQLVKIIDEIQDWINDVPIKKQTGSDQLHTNKMVSVLARKLHDIEKEKELISEINLYNEDDRMRNEIKKFIKKLPLSINDEAMNILSEKLINNLKKTEQTRRVSASTRYSIEPNTFLELTRDSSCCCCHSHYKPIIPSSALSAEDRANLQRIRDRTETAKISFLTSPTKDVSISPLPVDAASQTEIESLYVRPNHSQDRIHPCSKIKNACQRTQAVGSHIDIQPNVIIKEYHWDSIGTSMVSPNRTPCSHRSAFPTPRSPRPCQSIPKQMFAHTQRSKAQKAIQCSPSPCPFSCGSMTEQNSSQKSQPRFSRPCQFSSPESVQSKTLDQRNVTQGKESETEKNFYQIRRPQRASQYANMTGTRPSTRDAIVTGPCPPRPFHGQEFAIPQRSTAQTDPCNHIPCQFKSRQTWQKNYHVPLISSEDCDAGPSRPFRTSRMARQESLEHMTPKVCKSRNEGRKFVEDGCKYWEKISRNIPSQNHFEPYKREKKERHARCSCKDKFLTKCRGKNPDVGLRLANDSMKRCFKCCGVYCPCPSSMFFR